MISYSDCEFWFVAAGMIRDVFSNGTGMVAVVASQYAIKVMKQLQGFFFLFCFFFFREISCLYCEFWLVLAFRFNFLKMIRSKTVLQ